MMFVLPVLVVLIVLAMMGVSRRHPVAPAGDGPPPRSRTDVAVAEAIGYVGGALALSGLVTLVARSWHQFGEWARLGLLGGATVVLLAIGLMLTREEDPVVWRLRSFALLLSTGALAGFVGVFAADHLSWSAKPVVLSIGTTVAVYSALLWWRRDRPAQHLTTLVGVLLATGATMAWIDGSGGVGFALCAVGATWFGLGAQDLLPPQETAVPLGLGAFLFGPAVTYSTFHRWAPVLGLTLACLVIAAGAITHRFLFTGAGAMAVMGYLPWTVAQWFGDRLGPSSVLLMSGLALLVVMVFLLRRPHDDGHHDGRNSHLHWPQGRHHPHHHAT